MHVGLSTLRAFVRLTTNVLKINGHIQSQSDRPARHQAIGASGHAWHRKSNDANPGSRKDTGEGTTHTGQRARRRRVMGLLPHFDCGTTVASHVILEATSQRYNRAQTILHADGFCCNIEGPSVDGHPVLIGLLQNLCVWASARRPAGPTILYRIVCQLEYWRQLSVWPMRAES